MHRLLTLEATSRGGCCHPPQSRVERRKPRCELLCHNPLRGLTGRSRAICGFADECEHSSIVFLSFPSSSRYPQKETLKETKVGGRSAWQAHHTHTTAGERSLRQGKPFTALARSLHRHIRSSLLRRAQQLFLTYLRQLQKR